MISPCGEQTVADSLAEVRRITWLGFWANLALSGLKFAAGVFGHSSVLIADAVHSLSDLLTDVAVLIGSRYWGLPADDEHPYGHAKVETLVTLFIGSALVLVALGLLYDAVETLFGILHGRIINAPTVFPLGAAAISIVVKEYLYRITARIGTRIRSSALVANAWHHRSDALSSIPAFFAVAACLLLGNQYVFLDPLGTAVVALMIVHASWKIVRPSLAALLDAGASKTRCREIGDIIRSFEEVLDLHKLRTRLIGPDAVAVDVHVQVDPRMSLVDAHALSHRIKKKLLDSGQDVIDVFIHVEPAVDDDPYSAIQTIKKAPSGGAVSSELGG